MDGDAFPFFFCLCLDLMQQKQIIPIHKHIQAAVATIMYSMIPSKNWLLEVSVAFSASDGSDTSSSFADGDSVGVIEVVPGLVFSSEVVAAAVVDTAVEIELVDVVEVGSKVITFGDLVGSPAATGASVGVTDGFEDGATDGLLVGALEGTLDGDADGSSVDATAAVVVVVVSVGDGVVETVGPPSSYQYVISILEIMNISKSPPPVMNILNLLSLKLVPNDSLYPHD